MAAGSVERRSQRIGSDMKGRVLASTVTRTLILACVACLSDGFQPVLAADACDRACLEGHIDRYLAAVVAHDPRQLRFTIDARFTENGQALRIGDGLWATATGLGRYKLYLADVASGQAGFFGTLYENGLPVALSLRIKVDEQLISEVETLVVRGDRPNGDPGAARLLEQIPGPRPEFTQTVPAKERMSREDLAATANRYFTGLANNTGNNAAPFAQTCTRLENGRATILDPPTDADFEVRDYTDTARLGCAGQQESGVLAFVTEIRDRRFPLIDTERGLVLSFAFFDHSATITEITLKNGNTFPSPVVAPTTLQIAELFQIRDRKIDQIEALMNTVPYGMKSRIWDD
jgi:hypothetical protein